jgi:hypothetical protein
MFVLELAAQVRWYVKDHKLLILQCNIHLVVTIHQIFCRPRRSRIWGDSTGCRKQEAKWEAVQTGAMLVAAQMVLGLEGKMLGDQEIHIGRDEPNKTPTGKQPWPWVYASPIQEAGDHITLHQNNIKIGSLLKAD